MSVTRLLLYDYLSPEPTNEVIRMLLMLLCPRFGTSVVPPRKERRCPNLAVRFFFVGIMRRFSSIVVA